VRGIPGHLGDYDQIDWVRLEGKVRAGRPAVLGVAMVPFEGIEPAVVVTLEEQTKDTARFVVEHPDGVDELLFRADGLEIQ